MATFRREGGILLYQLDFAIFLSLHLEKIPLEKQESMTK